LIASLVDRETPLELLWGAAPHVVVPPNEFWSSVLEDEELAELGHLLEIEVGEALRSGLAEVCRRWFTLSSNIAAALELW
jgi:hypothetical protein